MIQQALARLLDGHDLSREEAKGVMGSIMSGEATPAQIAGFLIALRAKGETADEIAGCAEAMREHALPVRPQRGDLVDTAGTGGDGARTINISTAAALVAAAAGAGVAKHGNRAVSSACGSADVLEALGFDLDQSTERVARSIDELSPAGPNFVCEVVNGDVRARNIDPLEFGLPRCDPSDLRGGSPAENAAAIRAVLAGENGGRRSAILLNAAGAIAAGGHAEDLREGLELARDAIDSGAAAARLDELIAFTRSKGAE